MSKFLEQIMNKLESLPVTLLFMFGGGVIAQTIAWITAGGGAVPAHMWSFGVVLGYAALVDLRAWKRTHDLQRELDSLKRRLFLS